MRNEQNRRTALLHLFDSAHATVLKDCVTYRKRLIDDQNVGVGVDGYSERESHVHAARISLYGLVNEVSEFRKALNFWQSGLSFGSRESHQGRIHINVLDPGELEVESRTQFK